jgi:glycosyltransferase involved in cell wall biosynthesis
VTGDVRRVLVAASTFPASETDPVPSFVQELVVAAKTHDPSLSFLVIAPHDPRSSMKGLTHHEHYDEYRFSYFWPARLQVLAGQGGITPSLKRNKALYFLVPFFLLAERNAIVRQSKRFNPDIINAHWIIPQGVVVALARKALRVPIVLTIHGGDVFSFNNPLAKRLKRFALRAAKRVVVNSSATRAKTGEILASVDVATIPMGVTLASFPGRKDAAKGPLKVLFVGRLSEEKGVQDLLTALGSLRDHGIAFEARIAGSGPQEAELKARAASLDLDSKVSFLGWVNRADVPALYSWADVFVGPSITSSSGWIEALGVVFIEASASGLPVVTTDSGGMRDVVIDGTTGFIVPEQSPPAIAEALEKLAADPALRAKLGAAGLAHVTATFSWDVIAARYVETFRDAVSTID